MGEIMLENARALSSDPANELVIIMGHGPMTPKENEMDLAIMAKHAAAVQEAGGFKDVKYWNVQDDLPADKRAVNVRQGAELDKGCAGAGHERDRCDQRVNPERHHGSPQERRGRHGRAI